MGDLLDETAAAAISAIQTSATSTTITTTDGTKVAQEGATDLPGITEEQQETVLLSLVIGGLLLDIDSENDGDGNNDVNANVNANVNDDVNDDIDGDIDDHDNDNDNDNNNDDGDDAKVDVGEVKIGTTTDEEAAIESATEQGVSLLTKEEDKDKDKETATLSSATNMEENNDCHSGLWFCTGRDNNDDDIKVEGPSKKEEEAIEEVATEQVKLLVKEAEDGEKEKPRALSSATTTNVKDIGADRENDDETKQEKEVEESKV